MSADLALLILIATLLKGTILLKAYSIFCGIYFLLIVVYQITNAVFKKVYHKEFTGYEVIQYLSLGYKIVRHSAVQQIIFIFLAIASLLVISCYFFLLFFGWIESNDMSLAIVFPLTLFFAIPFYVKENVTTLSFSNKVFPLHAYELYKLLFKSSLQDFRLTKKIDIEKLMTQSPKAEYQLLKKPNIFVIVVESYGSIVLDEIQHPGNNYKQCIEYAEKLLREKKFSMVSALATSPVAGAGSWIAYSSFLFGINMQHQMIYEHLLSYDEMLKYNHIFRMLKKNGYTNYRVNAVGRSFDGVEIAWKKFTDFYAVDEWIHFKDMPYAGQMYGLGPSPSDQFILHYSLQEIRRKTNGPFTYFLLTQNSHNPFVTLPTYAHSWQESNAAPAFVETKSAKLVSLPKICDYFMAIDYEIKTISNFIAEEGNDDDIFIVFGDHQPPIFNEAKRGNETPVHVITKNKIFLEEWEKLGFQDGLLPSLDKAFFDFAGIYSIFQRAFVSSYTHEKELPEYEPNGKPLFND